MERIKITNYEEQLEPEDIVELHFTSIGMQWIQAAHVALIEWRLKGHKLFEVLAWSIFEDNTVVFKCRVKPTNPEIVTVAVIAAAIIGVGIIFKLTLDSAYKLVNVAPEALKDPGVKAIAGAGMAAIIGYIILRFLGK